MTSTATVIIVIPIKITSIYMLENNNTTTDAVVPDAGPVLAAGHLL